MAFDWSSLVELASVLQQQASSAANPEAYLRSAVGRAYFGAFGHANNYAVQFLNYQSRLTVLATFGIGAITPITLILSLGRMY